GVGVGAGLGDGVGVGVGTGVAVTVGVGDAGVTIGSGWSQATSSAAPKARRKGQCRNVRMGPSVAEPAWHHKEGLGADLNLPLVPIWKVAASLPTSVWPRPNTPALPY
ncbi:MAG: hypothetical protein ABID84_03025, partial [Chloroflexota bacterium]